MKSLFANALPVCACFGPSRPPISVFAGHLFRGGRPDRSPWDRGQGHHRGGAGRGGRFRPKQVADLTEIRSMFMAGGVVALLDALRLELLEMMRADQGALFRAVPGAPEASAEPVLRANVEGLSQRLWTLEGGGPGRGRSGEWVERRIGAGLDGCCVSGPRWHWRWGLVWNR